MDKLKVASLGVGTAAGQAKSQFQSLLDTLEQQSAQTADKISLGSKVATAAILAGATYGLIKIGEVATAGLLRVAELAADSVGLFTGSAYHTEYIDSLVKADDTVKGLQTSLGITAQAASALELALTRIGVPKEDFVSVYTAAEKAVDSNVVAFTHLGVAYQDANGKALTTQQVIANAAKVLDTYTAGVDRNAAATELGLGSADKVATAAKLTSDSYATSAKRLQDYYLVIGPGAQTAVAEYQQAMRDFQSENDLTSDGLKRAIADATIPILTELAELLKDGYPEVVVALRGALTGIVGLFEALELSAKALYQIVDASFDAMDDGVTASLRAVDKALHFDFTGAQKEVDAGTKAIEDRFSLMLDRLTANRDKAAAAVDLAAGNDSRSTPSLTDKPNGKTYFGQIDFGNDDKKTASPNVDVAKKLLEEQLKQLDTFISQEKELLTGRDTFLDLYYQNDEISIRDYYAARTTAQNDYVAKARDGYAKEIADVEAYIAATKANSNLSPDQSQARVLEAQTKLIDIREKLRKTDADATEQSLKDWFANRKAVEQYEDALKGLEAQIATNLGDSATAAGINFDIQYREKLKQFQAVRASDDATQPERNAATQGIVDLDQLREQAVAQAKLNDLSNAKGVILGDLANEQARIDLAVDRGTKSELQGLADTSAANKARLAYLEQIVAAYDEVAEKSGNLQDRVNADALHVELEKLRTQTNLVADAFNDAGKDVTENFFEKLTDRTTSFRDKLNALATDIETRLSKLGADAISNLLFAKDGGALSGVGDFFGSLFKPSAGSGTVSSAATLAARTAGGAGTSLSTTGASAALATFSTSVTAANAPMLALAPAAQAAAAALAQISGTGAVNDASNVGDFADAFELYSAKGNVFSGGNVVPFAQGGIVGSPTVFPLKRGGIGLMGEAGPEAIIPLRRGGDGSLGVANHGGNGGVVNNYTTVNVPAPQNRDLLTARQHGEAIRRALS